MKKKEDVIRKLISQAPSDLLADIYELAREGSEGGGQTDPWNAIISRAQSLGIFTPEEAYAFLRVVAVYPSEAK